SRVSSLHILLPVLPFPCLFVPSTVQLSPCSSFFFFNDTATTEIYTLPYTTLFRSVALPSRAWPSAAYMAAGPATASVASRPPYRSEEHTSELQSRENLVCRLLLEKKKNRNGEDMNREQKTLEQNTAQARAEYAQGL